MVNKTVYIVITLLLMVLQAPLKAQNSMAIDSSFYLSLSNYNIEYYDGKTGFAQNSIHGMYKDKEDVLWLGNYSGISSFDGADFQHFSGTQYTPADYGTLGTPVKVPQRQQDGLYFDPDVNHFRKIYVSPSGEVKNWQANTLGKIPTTDSVNLFSEFFWERNDSSAYYISQNKIYYKNNNTWVSTIFPTEGDILLWQVVILKNALFIIRTEDKTWFEYRNGKHVATHRLPFPKHEGLGGINNTGYDKYFQYQNNIYELNADVVGKPKLILKLKLSKTLPIMRSFLEDSISGNIFWGTLANGVIRLTEKPIIERNSSNELNHPVQPQTTLYLASQKKYVHQPQTLLQQLKSKTHALSDLALLSPQNALTQTEYFAYTPHKNKLWRRSCENGRCSFYQFDLSSSSWKKLKTKNGSWESLHFLYTSKNGTDWFTSTKGGLWAYFENELQKLPNDRQQFLNKVYQLGEDIKGFLWINTSTGLLQCNSNEIESYLNNKSSSVYYKSYAYASLQTNSQKLLRLNTHGKVFLEENGKSLTINPKYQNKCDELNIFVQAAEVNGQNTLINGPLTLDRDFGILEYKFTVPYWLDRENLYTEYYLKGQSKQWHFFNLEDNLRFQLLDPGKYTLKIRVRNGFGDHSTTEKEFYFKVLPYWYESVLFRVSVALFILLLFIGIYFNRLNRIKKRKQQLSKLIQEKKVELNLLNNNLRLNNLKLNKSKREQEQGLRERDEIVNLYTGKLRDPLKKISKTLFELSQTNHLTEPTKSELSLKKVEDIANVTYSLTESFFNWIREKEGLIEVIEIEIVFNEVLEDILHSYKDLLKEKRINLVNLIPQQEYIISDPNATSILLDIIINNAIKYSSNGTIEFSTLEQGEYTLLKIRDEGIGMSKSEIEEYMSSESKGFGLTAASNLIDHLEGYIEIESIPTKGTEVYLYFKKPI